MVQTQRYKVLPLKGALIAFLVMSVLLLSTAFSKELTGTIEFNGSAYRVGPGDVLTFHVYHQADLGQTNILVRSDGMASFNSVGELPVSGHSLNEVQQMLEEKISELVIDPIITVSVSQTKPGTIYLAGAIKHPGMYQLSTGNQNSSIGPNAANPISRIDLRLSNILSNAGGIKINADLEHVQIKRKSFGEEITLTVNLWKMLKEGDSDQDVMLQSGDSIYIPQLQNMAIDNEDYSLVLNSSIGPETFPVRIIGQLTKPGVYGLEGNSPYLNSAIAMAGGYTPAANKKVIAIRRFTNDTDVSTLYVDPNKMDIVLRPNDIVFVSEKKVSKTGRYFENLNKILQPFTNTAFSAGILGGL